MVSFNSFVKDLKRKIGCFACLRMTGCVFPVLVSVKTGICRVSFFVYLDVAKWGNGQLNSLVLHISVVGQWTGELMGFGRLLISLSVIVNKRGMETGLNGRLVVSIAGEWPKLFRGFVYMLLREIWSKA
jgi:hypothetical protein